MIYSWYLQNEVRITETCTDTRTNSPPAETPTFRFRQAFESPMFKTSLNGLGMFGITSKSWKVEVRFGSVFEIGEHLNMDMFLWLFPAGRRCFFWKSTRWMIGKSTWDPAPPWHWLRLGVKWFGSMRISLWQMLSLWESKHLSPYNTMYIHTYMFGKFDHRYHIQYIYWISIHIFGRNLL